MLKNKIAIITGASRGIGKSIALNFARNGASLVLTCLKEAKALNAIKEEAESYGAKVISFVGDVSSNDFCNTLVSKSADFFGTIDILVNCAGDITRSSTEKMSYEDWHRIIGVNLHSVLYLSKNVMPIMRIKKCGKIINITSQMAHMPHPAAQTRRDVGPLVLKHERPRRIQGDCLAYPSTTAGRPAMAGCRVEVQPKFAEATAPARLPQGLCRRENRVV